MKKAIPVILPLSPTPLPRGERGFWRQPETIVVIEKMPKAFMRLPCKMKPTKYEDWGEPL
ncbi:MAG: hypothetical protein LBV49_01025, partial [Azonexus sp.]|nr:hypothetical protein [Azonexus sp.]